MNINKKFSHLLTLLAGIASLAIVPEAFAIDPAHLIQEGNTNCRDYGPNNVISGIVVSSPLLGEDPVTVSDGDVEVQYWIEEIDGEQVLKFKGVQDITGLSPSPEGVNVVILRGDKNKAETYQWGLDEGVTQWPPVAGSSVDLTVTVPQTSIESLTFCYGLGLAEEVVITMPACGGTDLASGLTGTHYDACETYPLDYEPPELRGVATSDFECDIVDGKLNCCSCFGPLTGCVLGETDCDNVDFSDFDGSLVGKGSPSRYCTQVGTSYICYYRR